MSKSMLYRTGLDEAKAVRTAYPNMPKNMPAATAVPITPAMFGPMACINKKFLGFAS